MHTEHIDSLDTVLSQLEDNVDALSDRFGRYELTQDDNDLMLFLLEFQRLRGRQETMMNLSKTLLEEISATVEETKKELNARQHIQS